MTTNPARSFSGLSNGRMTSSSDGAALATFSRHRPTVHRGSIAVQLSRAQELSHDGGHAAGAVIVLRQVVAGWLAVDQKRHVVAHRLPVFEREFDADVTCDRIDMNGSVGRTADRAVDRDGVLEGGAGQDLRRREILVDHRDDSPAGLIGVLGALLVRCGRRGRTRQRHAERLGKRVHGGRRSHGVAVARTRRRRGHHLDELLVGDVTGGEQSTGFPEDGTRTGSSALPPAVQHRAAIERDRGEVRRRRRHDHRRRGLIAARRQDDAVDRITVQDLHQAQVGEIAVDGSRWPSAAFLDRVNRKFERNAARLADAGPACVPPGSGGCGYRVTGRSLSARSRRWACRTAALRASGRSSCSARYRVRSCRDRGDRRTSFGCEAFSGP